MKKLFLLLVAFVLLCAVAPARAAVEYAGEVCLYLAPTGSGTQILRLDVLDSGGRTYPIHGARLFQNTGDKYIPLPVHGTALIDGNMLELSLSSSNLAYGPRIANYSISIDLRTLTGYFFETKVVGATETPDLNLSFDDGSVTVGACP